MKTSMSKLLEAAQKAKGGQGFQDPMADKYWKVEGDSAGNAYAIIRFLPGKTEDDLPFVKTYSHGFKNEAGRWFIENCPTTIGEPCICCEQNGPLWNSGVEKDKEIVRQRKRKVGYIANVLVVSDSKHPENEGKVFLFKFGQKIFDKLMGAMQPEFEDETPMNPFDPVEGANFKLKMRRVEGYANFDKSEFDKPSKIGTDKEMAKIEEQLHDLGYFTDAKNFKSYDELKKKFDTIVGNTDRVRAPKTEDDSDDDFVAAAKAAQKSTKPAAKAESDDDGDDLAYFQALANED